MRSSHAGPLGGDEPPSADLAARLRGFGPLGLAAIVVVLAGSFIINPLSAALVLVWASVSRTPWREIGYVQPPSWLRDLVLGIVLGVALKLLMKAVVMPLLGADPINPRYQHLVGNPTAVLGMLFPVIVGAGWGEETVFRGYLFERLRKRLGWSPAARTGIVLITSALFGVAHEGVSAIQQATLVGLLIGTIYAIQGRLWMVMFAHAAFDLTAVAIIYWNLETRIAHVFFL
jgi:CAAX protease family protein